MPEKTTSETYARIYSVVRRIPRGRVATYGQIADLAGLPKQPRLVGYALHSLAEGSEVPWERVINARGEVSPRTAPGGDLVQQQLLEAEGVSFNLYGRVDLKKFQWKRKQRYR